MADEIRVFTVNIPASTSPNAPLEFPMAMPPRIVEGIQIVVPQGPNGVVGFAVLMAGIRVIPYLSDDWIVTSGENITWSLNKYPDSGDWSVLAYNTGQNDHTIYFRYLLQYIPAGAAPGSVQIDEDDLNADSSIPLGGQEEVNAP